MAGMAMGNRVAVGMGVSVGGWEAVGLGVWLGAWVAEGEGEGVWLALGAVRGRPPGADVAAAAGPQAASSMARTSSENSGFIILLKMYGRHQPAPVLPLILIVDRV
jgi:hypothetical protein